jgi:hypothetical protein
MRTLFAWGRIPAGDRRPLRPPPPRAHGPAPTPRTSPRKRLASRPAREEAGPQLSLELAAPHFDPSSHRERSRDLREIRFPRGGPAPLPGPWSLRAMVSGSTRP